MVAAPRAVLPFLVAAAAPLGTLLPKTRSAAAAGPRELLPGTASRPWTEQTAPIPAAGTAAGAELLGKAASLAPVGFKWRGK